jgi:hypothetical protein
VAVGVEYRAYSGARIDFSGRSHACDDYPSEGRRHHCGARISSSSRLWRSASRAYGVWVCTPTGTPTSSIPRLFRGFRGYSETYCELRKQVTREYVRTPNLSLGVKWSQV